MPALIVFLVIGSVFVYLARYNLTPVTVHLGPYIFSDVPLFYVIIGSLIAGIALSYVIYVAHAISTSWKMRGKEKEIRKNKDTLLELTKRVHQLELENEKLKKGLAVAEPEDPHAL
jgi:uncharacterized integral membrane protein